MTSGSEGKEPLLAGRRWHFTGLDGLSWQVASEAVVVVALFHVVFQAAGPVHVFALAFVCAKDLIGHIVVFVGIVWRRSGRLCQDRVATLPKDPWRQREQ